MDFQRPDQGSQTTWQNELIAGVRDQFSLLLGVTPLGMIFGALAVSSGISGPVAQGFSLFVFAGSSQFIALDLIRRGGHAFIVVLTIFVVNLRHFLYSATMAAYYRRLPIRWRLGLAWLLTDEAFAMTSLRYRAADLTHAHWYALGSGMALFLAWQGSTAAGILLGAYVPTSWPLDFALPVTFLAILIPALGRRSNQAAAVAAGTLAISLNGLPYRLGLLLAAVGGVIAGLAVQYLRARQTGQWEDEA